MVETTATSPFIASAEIFFQVKHYWKRNDYAFWFVGGITFVFVLKFIKFKSTKQVVFIKTTVLSARIRKENNYDKTINCYCL
jgi:hypothetical protein